MSITLIIVFAVIVLFIGFVALNYYKMKNKPAVADSKKIFQLTNKNFKAATASGITLVDFWAAWCMPCKMVAPILNDIAETESDKVKVGKVNVEYQQALAQKYKVRNIPTLLIFQNGKEVKRFVGVKTKKFLMSEVAELL